VSYQPARRGFGSVIEAPGYLLLPAEVTFYTRWVSLAALAC